MHSSHPTGPHPIPDKTYSSGGPDPECQVDQRATQTGAFFLQLSGFKWIRNVCALALGLSVLYALIASRHWPLVGDSSLMHYVVFLQSKGAIPYRDIFDINLPGTYLFEALAMRIFGNGAAGWRLYDFTLLAAVLGGCAVVAGRKRWFGAVFAGCLFALIHLQDGLPESGQRDLLLAVLLIWGYVAFFAAQRNKRTLLMSFLFGSTMGLAAVIKPVLLPLTAVLFLILLISEIRKKGQYVRSLLGATLGLVLPAFVAFLWLRKNGAWQAFWLNTLPLIRLHAHMGRRPLPFLLAHCLAPVLFLFIPWLLLQISDRPFFTQERIALMLGVLGTAIAYVLQGKGYPYQRYPCLAVLLLLVGLDLERSLKDRGFRGAIALITCLGTCLILAPRFSWLTSTFSDSDPFEHALSEQLLTVDPVLRLDGNVQCIDTFSGCIQTLYQMRIRESTGFLYDCYLFANDGPEVERYRSDFWLAYRAAHPRTIIVTNRFCFGDLGGFDKLNRWPEFKTDLDRNYQEKIEWHSPERQHWWNRWQEPTEFRIYVQR